MKDLYDIVVKTNLPHEEQLKMLWALRDIDKEDQKKLLQIFRQYPEMATDFWKSYKSKRDASVSGDKSMLSSILESERRAIDELED